MQSRTFGGHAASITIGIDRHGLDAFEASIADAHELARMDDDGGPPPCVEAQRRASALRDEIRALLQARVARYRPADGRPAYRPRVARPAGHVPRADRRHCIA
jgi:hypothetical protein